MGLPWDSRSCIEASLLIWSFQLSMGGGAREENLRFAMHSIKESHGCERFSMAVITIRNESFERESLEGRCPFCYKEIMCPGESRAPPPKGSSFGSRRLP